MFSVSFASYTRKAPHTFFFKSTCLPYIKFFHNNIFQCLEFGICLFFSSSIILFRYAFPSFGICCCSSYFHLLLCFIFVHCSGFISTQVVSSIGQQTPGGFLCLSSAYPSGLLVQDWFLSAMVIQIIILNWVWVTNIHITHMSYMTCSRCCKYWP